MKSKKYNLSAMVFYSVILALALVLPKMALATPVPDTGQTQSYTNTFGEDSDYTFNPPSYTDLGNGVVRDNVTGLEWQQATAPGTYTWHSAIEYCENLSLGGKDDWRLPTAKELASIIDSGIPFPGPTINTSYFQVTVSKDTVTRYYWSSDTYGGDHESPGSAIFVDFRSGSVSEYGKGYLGYYVRAVRGEHSTNNFVDNGNGIITDTDTGLEWQQATAPGIGSGNYPDGYSWEQALAYCESLTLADKNDWRLPTWKELQSIVDYNWIDTPGRTPSIDTTFFPDTVGCCYWSSTTDAGQPGNAAFAGYAWCVSFCGGIVHNINNKNAGLTVRAVRGGGSTGTSTILLTTITTTVPGTETTTTTTASPVSTTTTSAPSGSSCYYKFCSEFAADIKWYISSGQRDSSGEEIWTFCGMTNCNNPTLEGLVAGADLEEGWNASWLIKIEACGNELKTTMGIHGGGTSVFSLFPDWIKDAGEMQCLLQTPCCSSDCHSCNYQPGDFSNRIYQCDCSVFFNGTPTTEKAVIFLDRYSRFVKDGFMGMLGRIIYFDYFRIGPAIFISNDEGTSFRGYTLFDRISFGGTYKGTKVECSGQYHP